MQFIKVTYIYGGHLMIIEIFSFFSYHKVYVVAAEVILLSTHNICFFFFLFFFFLWKRVPKLSSNTQRVCSWTLKYSSISL